MVAQGLAASVGFFVFPHVSPLAAALTCVTVAVVGSCTAASTATGGSVCGSSEDETPAAGAAQSLHAGAFIALQRDSHDTASQSC